MTRAPHRLRPSSSVASGARAERSVMDETPGPACADKRRVVVVNAGPGQLPPCAPRAAGELARHGGDRKSSQQADGLITLESIAVTDVEASRWARVAAVPDACPLDPPTRVRLDALEAGIVHVRRLLQLQGGTDVLFPTYCAGTLATTLRHSYQAAGSAPSGSSTASLNRSSLPAARRSTSDSGSGCLRAGG
jgi:hypothetical protein